MIQPVISPIGQPHGGYCQTCGQAAQVQEFEVRDHGYTFHVCADCLRRWAARADGNGHGAEEAA